MKPAGKSFALRHPVLYAVHLFRRVSWRCMGCGKWELFLTFTIGDHSQCPPF